MSAALVQGELWGREPAAWTKLFEPRLRPLYEAALDALEPLAGASLLDAGCGSGLSLRNRGVVRAAAGAGPTASRRPGAPGGQRSRGGRGPAGAGRADRGRRGRGRGPVPVRRPRRRLAGPLVGGTGAEGHRPAGHDAVRAAVAEVLEADRKPDGSLRQDNVFRYVLATK